jgi:hypothetical protein
VLQKKYIQKLFSHPNLEWTKTPCLVDDKNLSRTKETLEVKVREVSPLSISQSKSGGRGLHKVPFLKR